jgi:hypothetical protein
MKSLFLYLKIDVLLLESVLNFLNKLLIYLKKNITEFLLSFLLVKLIVQDIQL